MYQAAHLVPVPTWLTARSSPLTTRRWNASLVCLLALVAPYRRSMLVSLSVNRISLGWPSTSKRKLPSVGWLMRTADIPTRSIVPALS